MKGERKSFTLWGVAVSLVCLSLVVFAVQSAGPPVGEWKRLHDREPILAPQGDGFESAGVFNPSVLKEGRGYVMLYRAQDKSGTSRLGYATSTDGVQFTRRAEPVMVPEADYEKNGGVEDPRVVKIGGIYYLTYTGYNRTVVPGLAVSLSISILAIWTRTGLNHIML